MPPILVFDVNETLLDLSALDADFEESFCGARWRAEWFREVLQLAFVTTITNHYSDFSHIARAALEIVEKRRDKAISEEQRTQILQTMRKLPAHPDVKDGLGRFRAEGLRLVALTNSTLEAAEAELANAGLRHNFERVFSADSVRRLKPAREPYLMVERELRASSDSLLLVAAHAWDIAGAMNAGWSAAFIARPGQVLDPLTPRPNFVACDLGDLAHQIFERQGKTGAR